MSSEYDYENWPLEARLRFEADAMEKAIEGEVVPGTFHAMNWQDKPHRVLRDAIKLMLEAADGFKEPVLSPAVQVYRLPTYTYVIQNTEANAGYDTEIVGSVQAHSYEEAVTRAAERGFNVSMFRSPYTLTRV